MKVLSLSERRKRGAIFFDDDPGLTEQCHRDECDINRIMANYAKTGQVPVYTSKVPQYSDFTQVVDYQTALNLVMDAQDSFYELPAEVRSEYENDPAKFLQALDDPAQKEKLIDLGVLVDDRPKPVLKDKKVAKGDEQAP